MIMLICSTLITTPVMPPMKPKPSSDRNIPEKTGLPQGALRSQVNRPVSRPFLRCATSIAPGTVRPWIMLASTAR